MQEYRIIKSFILLVFLTSCASAQDGLHVFPEIPPSVLSTAVMDWDDGHDPMNSRLFATTTTRQQINLSGFWEFATDPDEIGESEKYFVNFPKPETELWVPGTWNATARYWQYQGTAWLKCNFEVPENGHLRIHFGGVYYICKVWLDGKLIGENEGA